MPTKREERAELIRKAEELETKAKEEDRDLTDDELVEVNGYLDQAEALGQEIQAEEDRAAASSRLQEAKASLAAPLPRKTTPPETTPPEVATAIASAGGPAWLEDPTFGYATLGEYALAVREHDSPQTPSDPKLVIVNRFAAASGMSAGVPSEGGAMLAPAFSQRIWDMMQKAPENLMPLCDVYTVEPGSDSLTMLAVAERSRAHGSRWGGVRGYWKAEAAQMAASNPKLREVKVEPQELYVFAYVTDKLLRGAGRALTQFLERAASSEIVFLVNDAIVEGTGAGQPLGYKSSGAMVTIAKEGTQAAATVVTQNVNKMYARVPARLRMRARWFLNQDVEPALGELEAGSGGIPVYYPAGSIAGAPHSTLKGLPITPIEYAETLGTVGDISLVDLSAYFLGVRGNLQSDFSIHLRFDYAETAFRFMFEADGRPWIDEPLTPFKGTTKQSPFVNLATRS